MICDLCGSDADMQCVIGNFCRAHWESDELRQPYFQFLGKGKQASDWRMSDDKSLAIAEVATRAKYFQEMLDAEVRELGKT